MYITTKHKFILVCRVKSLQLYPQYVCMMYFITLINIKVIKSQFLIFLRNDIPVVTQHCFYIPQCTIYGKARMGYSYLFIFIYVLGFSIFKYTYIIYFNDDY